jgi:hypothetical protein
MDVFSWGSGLSFVALAQRGEIGGFFMPKNAYFSSQSALLFNKGKNDKLNIEYLS